MAETAAPETLTFKMQTKSSVVRTGKDGNKKVIGDVVIGTLDWGTASYAVRSGPWGKGALPTGTYTVKWSKLAEGNAVSAAIGTGMQFTDATTLKTSVPILDPTDNTKQKRDLSGFFVPIEAQFVEKRKGFGIHPDGNVYGTQGCIGLVGADAAAFWKKVLDTPAKLRPATLSVSGVLEAGADVSVDATNGSGE